MHGKPVGIEAGLDGEYLVDALQGVGWGVCQSYSPWAELVAYGAATGRVSEHWEYEALMAMSRAYVRAIDEGQDVHCIAPVDRDTEE